MVLFAAQRALGGAAPASLGAEAHYGESWLNQMWNQSTKTLYLQVGIGSGNSAGTFLGDHDLWRLPQADDSDPATTDRADRHRCRGEWPNGSVNFSGGLGGYQTGMVASPANGKDPFAAFDGKGSKFVDDVRAWQSDEPALDMTGSAVLAAALQEALNA